MLFRRCTYYTFILLMIAELAHGGDNLEKYRQQGKDLGQSYHYTPLSPEDLEAITPEGLRGESFDGEQAKKQIDSMSYQTTNIPAITALDPNVEVLVENGERALKGNDKINSEGESNEIIEKCIVESTLVPLTRQHTLTVQIKHKPKQIKKNKVCQGHTSYETSDKPKKIKKKKIKEFENDPTIKSYNVQIIENGLVYKDTVVSRWTHVDNASSCTAYHEHSTETSPEKWEEIDTWQIDQSEPLSSLNCYLTETENGKPETRLINGHQVTRPFWTKTQKFQCLNQQQNDCKFLKEKNCILTAENCIKQIGNQCLVLELFFRCRAQRFVTQDDFKDIFGMDSSLWETTYQPNTSFPDVATKLAVLDEMKKELQEAKSMDARNVRLFKGVSQQCSISIADNILYDCCLEMGGLATDIKLSKCNSDEIALVESRSKGLVHYIGEKKEKFLDLWVSRTEHVFCVFPSKLSRVFQEAARKQLNIDWGDAEHPDCRGLTQEEIKRLNFSTLDLTEAFINPKSFNDEEKIKKIENRLKQRIESI